MLAASSTRKRSIQPAEEKPLSDRVFDRSSSADEVVFFCPNPGCSVQIELVRGWSMEGLKLQCSGHGLTKHEPTEMVCTCVDGDARPLTSSFS
jgi:hypothetical protein